MRWHIDSLDFVIFVPPIPGTSPDALQPWQKLFGGPPLSYQGPMAGMMPPMAQAFGRIGDHNFSIQSQPGRLELKLVGQNAPGAAPSAIAPPVPQVSQPARDLPAALDLLEQYALRMVEGLNPARLGLILNLSKPEASAAEAATAFARNVPAISPLPNGATDLGFTLNVPKTIAVAANSSMVTINRLCRWGTARRQAMMFTVNTAGGQSIPTVSITETFASTLQIDINSSPSPEGGMFQTWTPEVAKEVYSKFKELVSPILNQGYAGLVSP